MHKRCTLWLLTPHSPFVFDLTISALLHCVMASLKSKRFKRMKTLAMTRQLAPSRRKATVHKKTHVPEKSNEAVHCAVVTIVRSGTQQHANSGTTIRTKLPVVSLSPSLPLSRCVLRVCLCVDLCACVMSASISRRQHAEAKLHTCV